MTQIFFYTGTNEIISVTQECSSIENANRLERKMGNSVTSVTAAESQPGNAEQVSTPQGEIHVPGSRGWIDLPGEVDSELAADPLRASVNKDRNTKFTQEANLSDPSKKYFTDMGENDIGIEVSTADRVSGSWNGNRAEIRSESYPTTEPNDFRSWYTVKEGTGFSEMQMFHHTDDEGFPEVMVEVNEHNELVLKGRGIENQNLGMVPENGRFGVEVNYDGEGDFNVKVYRGSEESPELMGQASGELTRTDGTLHFRTGVYFNGYNNKQFPDGYEMSVTEEINHPSTLH